MITIYNGKIENEKYWNLKNNAEYINHDKIYKQNQINDLQDILKNIVQENAMSDVKGGFFLSGGLDSSLLTAIVLKEKFKSNYKIPISIKFIPNGVEDEKYVKILENYFNTKIEWVQITNDIARNTLEELIKYLDEPLENPTHVGTYLMAKKARELGLKTVITGDGSDEFFIGYKRQVAWINDKNAKENYPSLNQIISKQNMEKLYKKDILNKLKNKSYIPENVKNMQEALFYERGERLPEYHNMRLDRMTMAYGIEAKVPFEDVRLAEFSLNISIEDLMRKERKGLLKEVSKKWLLDDVIYRKKSIFPSLPDEWISEESGINWAKNILLNENALIKQYFNQNVIKEFIEDHEKNKIKYGRELWALIVLELWFQNLKNWK